MHPQPAPRATVIRATSPARPVALTRVRCLAALRASRFHLLLARLVASRASRFRLLLAAVVVGLRLTAPAAVADPVVAAVPVQVAVLPDAVALRVAAVVARATIVVRDAAVAVAVVRSKSCVRLTSRPTPPTTHRCQPMLWSSNVAARLKTSAPR